ncbi:MULTISPECIES: RAMP superfamily CRISPR-associated protein [unclassified Methanothermobacter]|uniref:RAMP superfamily CRISPR-associated protein n=1 Tax=unclassified Methanothermobacter TaxID=2631116 RepID=UPI001F5B693C|nr:MULTISPECIES: RAMP superfamily CRISPR-associated protein [unclassified Methanothermobacter]
MRSRTQDELVHDYYLNKRSKGIKTKIEMLEKNHNDFKRFYPSAEGLKDLPGGSVLICIEFILKKPYTSRGEDELYENPIIRDKFTCLPIVRPSTWKGNLRFAAAHIDDPRFRDNDIIMGRLFGSGSRKENGRRGRLHFFPTFFERWEKDVITPISRKTRKPGRGALEVEVIKEGSKGEFHILYTPYPRGKGFTKDDVVEDLEFLAEALKLMFYTYGFSARKTSGFGVIRDKVEGRLYVSDQSHEFRDLHELRDLVGGALGE